ncbi:MAG: hypothetical protein CR982_00450 [Candidatus Cloacimonadota bacterium]|nr:MAG: hypothetical protein CR982_00450 [Candidatus Cloacimonadota bacterium]PIE78770.1 MAG: hypothetical protein CSA15_06210 [Candidatus Delongbacteria bacterium]
MSSSIHEKDNFIWGIKSKVYKFIRALPLISKILDRENRGILQLSTYLSKEKNILDLGSGTGNTAELLKEFNVISTDLNFGMCKISKKVSDIAICCNLLNIPFQSSSLEAVVAVGVSEYIEDLSLFIKEIKRVLANESLLIMSSSPKSIFSYLRKVTGNKIFLRDKKDIVGKLEKEGFFLIKSNKIASTQDQYLFKLRK